MHLHDAMETAVADVCSDPVPLAAASRRRGLSIRRRRHTLASVGAATAAAVLAVTVWSVLPGDGGGAVTMAEPAATPDAPRPLSGQTAPITGRGAAAALAAAVSDQADGTLTRLQGEVSEMPAQEAMAALLFRPAGAGGPAGEVFVNLQPLVAGGPAPYACERTFATRCTVEVLANGDTLRIYRDDEDSEYGPQAQRAVAEVLSPRRHLRVLVSARNSNPWEPRRFLRSTVLDLDQLASIATRPWWSRTRLPQEFVTAGEQLEDFSSASATD